MMKQRCLILLALAAGCSSNASSPAGGIDPAKAPADERSETAKGLCPKNDLQIFFSPMYTAVDGVHEFQIPAVVANVDPASITWSVSDPALVDFQNDATLGGVMLSARKAGKVTVLAKAVGGCGTSELTITSATAEDWSAGNMRYNNGIKLNGNVTGRGRADAGPPMTDIACTNCHGPTAITMQFRTVAHTPEQTGGFSDEELVNIFTMGMVPRRGYFDSSIVSYNSWQMFHRWEMSPAEAKGVVVYLRSLTPQSQTGMRGDFGGGRGDGGRGNRGDAGTDVEPGPTVPGPPNPPDAAID
jgi:hypothetical protein